MTLLSPVYSQQFRDLFDANYQASSKLRGSVMELHGLVGSAYKLKVMNASAMRAHGAYNADIPASPIVTSGPSISFDDWELKLVLDNFESVNINANVLTSYATAHTFALGRTEDYEIINALNNSGTTKTVPVNFTGSNSNMPFEKLLQARALLGKDEVGNMDQLHCAIHENQLQSMLQQEEITNSQWNTIRALVAGEIDTWLGMKFHILGDRINPDGTNIGLPLTGTIRTVFCWAQASVTLGYRMDPQVRMVEVPQNARVETLSTMSLGAVAGRPKGIVSIACDESVVITT